MLKYYLYRWFYNIQISHNWWLTNYTDRHSRSHVALMGIYVNIDNMYKIKTILKYVVDIISYNLLSFTILGTIVCNRRLTKDLLNDRVQYPISYCSVQYQAYFGDSVFPVGEVYFSGSPIVKCQSSSNTDRI